MMNHDQERGMRYMPLSFLLEVMVRICKGGISML